MIKNNNIFRDILIDESLLTKFDNDINPIDFLTCVELKDHSLEQTPGDVEDVVKEVTAPDNFAGKEFITSSNVRHIVIENQEPETIKEFTKIWTHLP